MTIDERLEALTMNLELAFRDVEAQNARVSQLLTAVEKLAAIAESHERRLGNLKT